jgi:hypothetical protein
METKYTCGEIIIPDKFDLDLNVVASNGIHYVKTVDAAYYHRLRPETHTGWWFSWNANGESESTCACINGEKVPIAISQGAAEKLGFSDNVIPRYGHAITRAEFDNFYALCQVSN